MSTSRPMLVASRASVHHPDHRVVSPEEEVLSEGRELELEKEEEEDAENEGSVGSRSDSASESRCSTASLRKVDSALNFDTDLEIEEEKEDFDLSGARVYAETCRELGVVPASYFVRHMRGSQLTMRHHGLGPLGAKAISVPLVSNTIVNNLDLEDNWIEAGGAVYIADMLKENCYITHLNLAHNNIGSRAAKALCETLLVNSTLTHINLSGNGFQDKDGAFFAQVILENSQLQKLNLSHNSFGDATGESLGHAIGENESLESLDLSWNNFRRNSGVKIMDGIQVNSRLKRVNLSWNGLGIEGSMAISNCLRNNSILTELDISCNRISPEGAAVIGKGLEMNETLQILRAGQNLFGSQGALILLASINNERSILTELDLTEVWVEKEFDGLQQDILESRPDLVVKHGGIIGNYVLKGIYGKSKDGETDLDRFLRTNTWAVIRQHMETNNLNINDVFRQHDKDGKGRISTSNFKDVIQGLSISLTEEQMTNLHERLEALSDAEGMVNYREIIEGATGIPQQ